jgi:hypothetical protein
MIRRGGIMSPMREFRYVRLLTSIVANIAYIRQALNNLEEQADGLKDIVKEDEQFDLFQKDRS